jgi:hypothetical protein
MRAWWAIALAFLLGCQKERPPVGPQGYVEPPPVNWAEQLWVEHEALPVVPLGADTVPVTTQPSTAADTCTVLTLLEEPYTYCAAAVKQLQGGGIDSIKVRAVAYGITNTLTWYDGQGFTSLQPVLYNTFGFTANVVHNNTQPSAGLFEVFIIIEGPAVLYGANTYDRPKIVWDLYRGGSIVKRVITDFWEGSIRLMPSMGFTQVQGIMQNYAHANLYAHKTGLTSSEIYGLVNWYRQGCITGHTANFYGLGLDSFVYRVMHDTLKWAQVKM